MINNQEYNNLYRNSNYYPYYPNNNIKYQNQNDRMFLGPFLVGGVAGTALGYGIANNNIYKNQGNYYPYPQYYFQPYPPIGVPYYYK